MEHVEGELHRLPLVLHVISTRSRLQTQKAPLHWFHGARRTFQVWSHPLANPVTPEIPQACVYAHYVAHRTSRPDPASENACWPPLRCLPSESDQEKRWRRD